MEKSTIVVGVDDSERSLYALEWTLDHLFSQALENSRFKLVVVYAKPVSTTAIGLSGHRLFNATADLLPVVEQDLKRMTAKVLEKAKEVCEAKLVNDAVYEVMEGDARYVLCEAVENHQASVLVVGSHGYGTFKRTFLGSVSDYCAHHAHCSVLIVKKPKNKH